MTRLATRHSPAFALFAALAFGAGGCGQNAGEAKNSGKDKPTPPASASGTPAPVTPAPVTPAPATPVATGDHSGWWCPEHGLPEEVCDLCSKKYREAEKAKGNWCEHNRVKTSCFKCNPGLKDKYAIEYKAKFGTAPPPTEDEEKGK